MKLRHLAPASDLEGRTVLILALLVAGAGLGTTFWMLGKEAPRDPSAQYRTPSREEASRAAVTVSSTKDRAPSTAGSFVRPVEASARGTSAPERGGTPSLQEARPRAASGQVSPEDQELLRALSTGEAEERLAVARRILAKGHTGALAARAIETLLQLAPREATLLLRELPRESDPHTFKVTPATIRGLARSEVLEIEDLRQFYEHGDDSTRLAAAIELEARGDSALITAYLARYQEELESKDVQRRLKAALELSTMRSPSATRAILVLLDDADEDVRIHALRSLARSPGDASLADSIRPLLDDPSERVQSAAKSTLNVIERSQRRRSGGGQRPVRRR